MECIQNSFMTDIYITQPWCRHGCVKNIDMTHRCSLFASGFFITPKCVKSQNHLYLFMLRKTKTWHTGAVCAQICVKWMKLHPGEKQTSSSENDDVPDDDHGDVLQGERVQCVFSPLWTNSENKKKCLKKPWETTGRIMEKSEMITAVDESETLNSR